MKQLMSDELFSKCYKSLGSNEMYIIYGFLNQDKLIGLHILFILEFSPQILFTLMKEMPVFFKWLYFFV